MDLPVEGVFLVVGRVFLEVSGRGIQRVEEGSDRRQMLGCRAPGMIGPPAGEPIARRGAGEPGVVIGAWLRRVVSNVNVSSSTVS